VLVEKGRDIDYVEHWHRDEAAATQPTAAVAMCDRSHGESGALLRVGNMFMFARDRAAAMPAQDMTTAWRRHRRSNMPKH